MKNIIIALVCFLYIVSITAAQSQQINHFESDIVTTFRESENTRCIFSYTNEKIIINGKDSIEWHLDRTLTQDNRKKEFYTDKGGTNWYLFYEDDILYRIEFKNDELFLTFIFTKRIRKI